MPRKRKSDQPTKKPEIAPETVKEPEAVTATITAEPEAPQTSEAPPSFVERLGERTNRAVMPDPFGIAGDNVAGVRLFENRRDRVMAIKFDERPSQAVINIVKEAGYRWNPTDQVWTHPVIAGSAMSTRIEAERLYQEARQMVRQDKGIVDEQDIPF